ncbi:MAG: pyruvate kinase alpha/beta domain-containing protein [Nitrososphaeria archaeon]|jgi:hypothetical protein
MNSDSIEKIVYFESAGEWTGKVFEVSKEYAEKSGIKDVVVASTKGETGAKASAFFKGYNLVVVTHANGHKELGKNELTEKNRKIIERNGGKILTATHALSGTEKAFKKKLGTVGTLEIMASTLRTFGQGVKVCLEIAVMAADAGLIPVDRDVICIGGTGKAADTALLIKAANSGDFFDLKVRKVLCKPSDF